MDMAELNRIVQLGLGGQLRLNEPMRKHTSWRAGGAATRAYFPRDLDDFVRFVRVIPSDEPVYVVGLGSNLLVRDGGLRGTVVFTHGALKQIRIEDGETGEELVYAEAGVASPKVARLAATHSLGGAEFLAGIPGTVGGALAMNAGCFGSETWDIVEAVLCLRRDGELVRCAPNQFEIGYRHVAPRPGAETHQELRMTRDVQYWFAAAWFKLVAGDREQSRREIKELLERRIATQPLEQPNAGSVFRNPPGDYAARLIESCGLKGFAIGGAMVSTKHANFIVNTGAASATDIEALIEHVQTLVTERCGVELEREVLIVGERA
ncbi:MAG TPA: UDP-N-acetylmuramate dehydrogenase [Burkholderiales bacterium]|nr:UDP-N-acetylmuramate dehydrogenase [Burkholderiales bacterium]